jgi:hypothetical protein
MKTLVATLALVLVYQVQAQTNHGTNLQHAQGAADASLQPAPANGPSIAPGQSSGNPIYILNNQRINESQQATLGQSAAQAAVQEQPTSIIQEAPLKVSPADQMRKKRQDFEVQTEDGIVQALEKARIDDELRRRDKFNNAIAPVNQQTNGASVVGDNNTVQQNNVVQQPQVQVQVVPEPQPVKKAHSAQEELDEENVVLEKPVRKPESKEEKVDIRGEIRAAMAESSAKKVDEEKQTYYVAALASFGTYYDVVNVDRSLGYGVSVGTVTPERFVVEGVFMYADYHIAEMYSFGPYGSGGYYNGPYSPGVVNMRQYTFGAAAKYQFLPGKFRPVAGALLNYNRRNYSYDQYGSFRSTDAIDVGALVGADLQLTPGFALGVDFRYNTNLGHRSSNPGEAFSYQAANNPEKLDYYTVNLIGKFTF